jgi:hypothetical protein
LLSIDRFCVILFSFASLCAAADTPLWEPGKVVAVEEVSSPAKTPDPSCRAVPKGATPPARCRPSNLRAEQFWRVTVDVGNKRLVVRPYRAPSVLDALNQDGTVYLNPNLTAGASVEVAVVSSKAVRLRSDQGQGNPAIVDSQELLSSSIVPLKEAPLKEVPLKEVPPKAELPPRPLPNATAPTATASTPVSNRVVLLESGDFVDMEVQEFKSQDIGDGAVLYSFTGDSSPIRAGSSTPVLLFLAEGDAAISGNLELSRLQVGKGTRQLVYSTAKKHSASSLPIVMTQVSATVRKVNVKDPLPPGEYVVLLENSDRGFLFSVH